MNSNFLNDIGLSKQLLDNNGISGKQILLKAGTTIFESDDKPDVFLILVKGKVRVDITTKSGRDMVLYRISGGQPCVMAGSALMNDDCYSARATCETDVVVFSISLNHFYKAIEHSKSFMRYILNDYSKRMLTLTKFINKTTSKDVLYDLCHWLLSQDIDTDSIKVTHNTLAQEIGTAREVVSRKLYFLEEKGAIKTTRGRITILDRSFLENFSMY